MILNIILILMAVCALIAIETKGKNLFIIMLGITVLFPGALLFSIGMPLAAVISIIVNILCVFMIKKIAFLDQTKWSCECNWGLKIIAVIFAVITLHFIVTAISSNQIIKMENLKIPLSHDFILEVILIFTLIIGILAILRKKNK